MNLRRIAGTAAGLTFLAAAGVACSDSVPTAEEGACIEELSLIGDISELPTVDCDEDHAAQVVGLFDHDGGDDFPGDDEIEEEANERCQELFEDFVGAPVQETSLSFGAINPTEETWEQADDRETICVATALDGSDLDQSIEDAAEEFEAEGVPFEETEDEIGDGGDSGEDTSLDDFADLIDSCEGCDMADCDELFQTTPVGSEAEEIGLSCGGERDSATATQSCEAEFG
jgi:hypothetical protein